MQLKGLIRKFLIDNCDKTGKQLRSVGSSGDTRKEGCFYNIVSPSNKIQCDHCRRDISKNIKVLAEDFDFCLGCFAQLQEAPEEYHLINKLDYPLIDPEWTADEELMLFEGLEKHGFGNWSEIAELIGTNKTREDVEDHYVSYYLDNPDFMPTARVITSRDEDGKLVKTGTDFPVRKFQRPNSRIFSAQSVQSFQRGSLTVGQASTGAKVGSNPAQIVGYMPKRGDFEVQFDNDAQLLLAEMEFNDDDSPKEKQMKFRLIDIYNHKLNERVRRKEFVISRKLLDLKEQLRLDKTRTKEEKEIYNMMKVFARFSTADEHQQLVQGIVREKQVRAKLVELNEHKKKGFRTLAQANEEAESRKRREQKARRKEEPPLSLAQGRSKRSKKDSVVEKGQFRPSLAGSVDQGLCQRFNISAQQYLMVKETLIRESLRQGIIELDSAASIFKLDRAAVEGVLDFLVQKDELLSSWVQKDSEQSYS